ncbi:MAG: hypothetical protein AAGA56_28310 [Myxococcota bacterium]
MRCDVLCDVCGRSRDADPHARHWRFYGAIEGDCLHLCSPSCVAAAQAFDGHTEPGRGLNALFNALIGRSKNPHHPLYTRKGTVPRRVERWRQANKPAFKLDNTPSPGPLPGDTMDSP